MKYPVIHFKKINWFSVKRSIKHWWQRRTRGFSDDETWSLNYEIAKFTLPRLKLFKEFNFGYPSSITSEEWNIILDKIIFSLEYEVARYKGEEKLPDNPDDFSAYFEKVQEGFRLFGEWFGNLWW